MVPLAKPVVQLLEQLQPLAGDNPRVFAPLNPANIERDWWGTVRARAEVIAAAAGGALEDFTLQDLRRTCATGCAELGALPHVVSAILGHAATEGTIPVSGTYNRYKYFPEKAAALSVWAVQVQRIVSGKPGRAGVMSFGRG